MWQNKTMAKDIQKVIPVRPDYQINRGPIKSESGLSVQKFARAFFDFSALDSAGVANSAIGAHGTGVFLPNKAVIVQSWYQVVTGFTSGTNLGTIALAANAANDIKTATVVSNAAYVTPGIVTGVSDGAVANMKSMTAERELTATVAVETLTAGRLVLFVEYYIGE